MTAVIVALTVTWLAIRFHRESRRLDRDLAELNATNDACHHVWLPAGPFLDQCTLCGAVIEHDSAGRILGGRHDERRD